MNDWKNERLKKDRIREWKIERLKEWEIERLKKDIIKEWKKEKDRMKDIIMDR